MMATKKPMDYLNESAVAISYCDTNGNLLMKTIHDKEELGKLTEICKTHPELQTELDTMFHKIEAASEEDRENFLLTLGASLRMFPEQNPSRSGTNHLTRFELAELVHSLDAARNQDESKLAINGYGKYMDIFLNLIDTSLDFAKSQKFQTFSEMAKQVHAPALLNNVLENGWENYANKLPLFKTYWSTLDTTHKERLASTLFNLAAKQEGVKLTKNNSEIQQILAKEKKAQPISFLSRRTQTTEQQNTPAAPRPTDKKNP